MLTKSFPYEYQLDGMDCGPACLKVIAKHFGKYYSLQYLRDLCGITREGVSFLAGRSKWQPKEPRVLPVRKLRDKYASCRWPSKGIVSTTDCTDTHRLKFEE